jgi:hypothetical protein
MILKYFVVIHNLFSMSTANFGENKTKYSANVYLLSINSLSEKFGYCESFQEPKIALCKDPVPGSRA